MREQQFLVKPLTVAIGLMVALPVLAQEDDFSLEEIVVTAQKREQSMQDVPVSVSAFSGDDLSGLGIEDINQVSRRTPNVTLEASRATNSTLTAYIRGIGQQDPLWGFEPGVGIYVDDVYLARPQSALLDVYDVERIEVLRGPQGTLYGKNTIGGAVKYVTKSISGDARADVSVNLGSYNQRDLKLAASAPVIEDKLWIGGAVAKLTRDGYGQYVGPINEGVENGNKDLMAYRISMEAQPTDSLNIRLNLDRAQDDSNNRGGHRMTNEFVTGAAPLDNVFDTRSAIDPTQEVNSEGAALTIGWQATDTFSFKSITAYREGDTYTSIDFDNQQLSLVEAPGTVYTDEQISQEFQLIYTGEDLSGVVGVYYFDGDATGAFDLDVYKSLYNDGVNPLIGTRTLGAVNTVSKAVFAQGTYQFSDQLSMTLGGRYSKDEKDTMAFFSSYNVLAGVGDFNNQIVSTNEPSIKGDWSDFSPRLGVEYYPSEDVMLFASLSKGFKSGGVDPRANVAALPASAEPFDPETVKTLEFGAKSELFNNKLRLNATAFFNDYTDMQVKTSVGIDIDNDGNSDSFAGQVINAGKASARGFEIEALAALSESLTMNLTYGFIDTQFDEVLLLNRDTDEVEDASDLMVISNTPRNTMNLGLTYDIELSNGNLMVNANAAYRSELNMYEVETAIDQPGYTIVDANIVWTSTTGAWKVGLHGKNLTDKAYRTSGYFFSGYDDGITPSLPNLADSTIGYYGAPRTVTLNLGYQF